MSTLEEKFYKAEDIILKRSFRSKSGFDDPCYIFDYDPAQELYVRDRIEFLVKKGKAADLNIIEFDLYDIIIQIFKDNDILEMNFKLEKKGGLDRVTQAVTRMLSDDPVVQHIEEHSDNADVVFLTGIGKCYPLFRAHNVLNKLDKIVNRIPVVMFYPGSFDGQYLKLFSKLTDDNHYRAFKLVD